MRIALIGYGKMGKAIEQVAICEGHEIIYKIDKEDSIYSIKSDKIDVAIEFTQPSAAFDNLYFCLDNHIPVISGTTGWLSKKVLIENLCLEKNGTFLYASNFSVGVNLFFELNEWLASKMKSLHFTPHITEVHHTEKKDSPSGTAISLAEGLFKHSEKTDWINEKTTDHQKLSIISERKPNVPGIHSVCYTSELESIEITHKAHNRSVFAESAIKVAEWIYTKKGIYTMSDFINHF
ncbi:MAG: 4-hydroxy-tetrahydrodipicolinate reductase [Bacteroidota bacterium]